MFLAPESGLVMPTGVGVESPEPRDSGVELQASTVATVGVTVCCGGALLRRTLDSFSTSMMNCREACSSRASLASSTSPSVEDRSHTHTRLQRLTGRAEVVCVVSVGCVQTSEETHRGAHQQHRRTHPHLGSPARAH